jgi:hypothetical protein
MRTAGRIVATALFLAAVPAFLASAEQAPRRLLVAVQAKGGDAYTAIELLQLSRSLMAAIQVSGTEILIVDWGPDPFPVDDPDSAGDEVKRTADCWLVVTIGGGRKSPTLSLASYDPLLKKQAISAKVQLGAAFDFPEPPAAAWAKVVELVTAAYPPLDADQPVRSTSTERPALWTKDLAVLTLHAVPGTVVQGLDGEPRTVGEDGTLKENVRSPATYILSATHPGQLPLETVIYLEDDRDLTLPQHPLARWAIDAGLFSMSFPQAEAFYFLVPGWLYAQAGLMTSLAGLAFTNNEVFWSTPLTTLSAGVGTYAFFAPESWFRTYVSAGVLLRIAHPAGFFGIEPIAPAAIQLTFGIEASPWPRSRFFLEWQPTEYLTAYPDLFGASMPFIPSGYVFLPFAVLDMGGFRIGWRWML